MSPQCYRNITVIFFVFPSLCRSWPAVVQPVPWLWSHSSSSSSHFFFEWTSLLEPLLTHSPSLHFPVHQLTQQRKVSFRGPSEGRDHISSTNCLYKPLNQSYFNCFLNLHRTASRYILTWTKAKQTESSKKPVNPFSQSSSAPAFSSVLCELVISFLYDWGQFGGCSTFDEEMIL